MAERRVLEGTVKDAVKRILKDRNVYYTMPPANGYGVMGNFDIICCVNGMFLGIEVKRDVKEKPTALQSLNAHQTMMAGGVALLIHKDNLGMLMAAIDNLLKDGTALSYWPVDGDTT